MSVGDEPPSAAGPPYFGDLNGRSARATQALPCRHVRQPGGPPGQRLDAPVIEPLLLTATPVLTCQEQRRPRKANGLFLERDEGLFLVTSRHVNVDEPSKRFVLGSLAPLDARHCPT